MRTRLSYRFDAPVVRQLSPDEIAAEGYSSQLGQDLLVDRHLLARLEHGTFVDVGAHDGVTLSNSWFFQREREWSGVCIEPNPNVFPQLCANRAPATCVQTAIGIGTGTVPFRVITGYAEMLSGVDHAYHPRHRARIEREVERHGGSVAVIDVPIRSLDAVLEEAGLQSVDLLSIDVEGAEPMVLDTIDLRRFGVRVVVVENNYRSWEIARRFHAQGYQLMCRLAWDEVWVPNPFALVRR